MRFCAVCDRAMTRDSSSGRVVYTCYCGASETGKKEDARIGGAALQRGDVVEMYDLLLQNAGRDPVNMRVMRPCPECGLDYMVQIRVGAAEEITYTCKCGFRTRAPNGPPAERAGT